MPYISSMERFGWEAGFRKGLLKSLEVCLKIKFGADGLTLLPEIRTLQDNEVLEAVLKAIETAASLDELRRIWAPKRRPRKKRRT